jgi:hypothetical protein
MPSWPTAAWILATKINVIATASALNSGAYRTPLRPLGTSFDDIDSLLHEGLAKTGEVQPSTTYDGSSTAMLLASRQTLTSLETPISIHRTATVFTI